MADEEYIGLNSVMIMSDDALAPENIKEGTSIFGVEGTYKATDVTFTVADGNNAPSNPQNNVIWVQTDTEIPSYAILSSVERPSNPAEGMVWIVNGQTSSGAFDLTVDDNVVAIYPQKAYQYVNGEWTPRPIKVYKENQWVDLFQATINITYPAGAQCSCTDGVITYIAPDTSGFWELTVPNQGAWTAFGSGSGNIEEVSVNISTNNEIANITLVYFAATIKVTYPKGTVAITNGQETYTHSGGGTYTCSVIRKGDYSVKATYEGLSQTKTISIVNGDSKTVSFTYEKYIYNNGNISSVAGNWTYTESKQWNGGTCASTSFSIGSSLTYSAGRDYNDGGTDARPRKGTVYNTTKINMSGYDKLAITSSKAGASFRIGTTQTGGVQTSVTLTNGTSTIDISGLDGSYYISIYNNCSGDTHYGISISRMRLYT